MSQPSWLARVAASATIAASIVTGSASGQREATPVTPPKDIAPANPAENTKAESDFFKTLNQQKNAPDATPYIWMDQDGKEVNLKALETSKLKGKKITLTFGFNKCPTFCEIINDRLKAIHGMNGDMAHVVVSVNPDVDATEQGRKEFVEVLVKNIGLTNKQKDQLIVLFPVKKDSKGNAVKNDKGQFVFDAFMASEVQIKNLDAQINAKNPKAHTPNIFLFDDKGAFVDKKPGTRPVAEFKRDWKEKLDQPKQPEKAR